MPDRELVAGKAYPPAKLAAICYHLSAVAYPNGAPWRQTTFKADIAAPQTRYDLLTWQDQPIGFISRTTVLDETEITNLAVHPDFRRQGHARWLLKTDLAQLDQGDQVFLEVRASNQAAQQLYLQCGFEQIATRQDYYHDPVEDAWIMRKIID
ncbi:ribosomal protein S18-alanine N-acetyltransferase [Lactiplantibacillus carotarum]|uniref:ribosomal protein S18-alanine N-acetyltransferase n=1 Tax=Lactiplantibacillus carotarum TaxID=2993456 RepID=UPI00298F352F|nr:ribosomal protein S18-alanine N-acetyltransferase [Lactiplantibacillus carotarum]